MGAKQSSLTTGGNDFHTKNKNTLLKNDCELYLARPGEPCDSIFSSTKQEHDLHEPHLAEHVTTKLPKLSFSFNSATSTEEEIKGFKDHIHFYLSRLGEDHDTIFSATKHVHDQHQPSLEEYLKSTSQKTPTWSVSTLKLKL